MKILIYMSYNTIKPTGGPRGYLYNLNNGLDKIDLNIKDIEIEYLPQNKKEKYKNIFKNLPKTFQQKYFDNIMYKKSLNILKDDGSHRASIDLSKYDIIHFHSSFALLSVRDSLKEYKGKILLTNHSPKPQFKEWIEDVISQKEYIHHQKTYDKLSVLESISYYIANYIIFPCEEAEEPYQNNWDLYKTIKEHNKNKYRYILTGTETPVKLLSRKEVCNKYFIPEKAFIISFIGRHNETKGYDSLLKIGEKIISEYDNVYFLIAGNEGPLYGLKNKHWIEVGWVTDPGTYYSASDIFLLPNKETYFDLVMLEALSSETIILASRTGGNRYFEHYNSNGLVLYNNIDEAVCKLEELINCGHEILNDYAKNNRKIYEKYYTVNVFAQNYINMLKSLYNS